MNWQKGSHQIKVGGEARVSKLFVFYDSNKRGNFTFDGTVGPWASLPTSQASSALKALADFMAGDVVTGSIVLGNTHHNYFQNTWDVYAQDVWSATPKVTLNYGLRYTYPGVLGASDGPLTAFIAGRGMVSTETLYPADETDVQWAPRGNKVSYIVHAKVGDVVRTVHVPTAMQLSVDFPYASIRSLAWDRGAERYAVVVSSPDASERIESMKYSGEARRTDLPPATRLDVVEEPVAGALLLRPSAMHYGERLPLIVWVADPPFVWNDRLGSLMRKQRVACAIMRRAPDDAFWAAVRAIPWIDTQHVSVKDSNGVR